MFPRKRAIGHGLARLTSEPPSQASACAVRTHRGKGPMGGPGRSLPHCWLPGMGQLFSGITRTQLQPPPLHWARRWSGCADCPAPPSGTLRPLTVPSPLLDGLAPCGTLAGCPREPEPEPGALAAVPATHQNHKQTLLPRNAASPQHPWAESWGQSP